ncbi:MAG TPA: hypothetical protein DCQ98_20725 [Planctomycetaceae bacterium]|nr:hypothetical protein [Planctomycetaceae bacterium]HRE99037.1 hypothetical protein [Pirellulaceae bacterium]
MDFQERLQKAIHRGLAKGVEQSEQAKAKRLSKEEIRSLYTKYRLDLSEHIEACMKHLPDHFPGFVLERLYGELGWGAAVRRDDSLIGSDGRRSNVYSRLEVAVKSITEHDVLDLQAKGTIRNRELFRRHHFQAIAEVDLAKFREMVDVWIVEFAELYAAATD